MLEKPLTVKECFSLINKTTAFQFTNIFQGGRKSRPQAKYWILPNIFLLEWNLYREKKFASIQLSVS